MVYAYYRYSTNKQSELQQEHRVREYCHAKGITIDAVVVDKGVSGSVSIENRNLAELIGRLKVGDTIVVSEVSRISRSVQDFCTFMLVTMPKLQARVVICSMGLDIDCANMNAMTQMQLMMFSFFAQIEREFIQDRTQAALDAKKQELKINGGFTTKAGNWCSKLGNPNGFKNTSATEKAALKKKKAFMKGMAPIAAVIRELMATTTMQKWEIADKLNQMGFKTARGGKFRYDQIDKILRYDEEGIYY